MRVRDGLLKLQLKSKAYNLIADKKPTGAIDEMKTLIDEALFTLKLENLSTHVD